MSHQQIDGSSQALLFHTTDQDHQNNGEQLIDGVEIEEQNTVEEEIYGENTLQTELPKKKVISYAIGHFYNDLCASMWFTYLLIFLEYVELLSSWQAGLLMFIGQITDAICTPLVGLLSDHSFLPNFLLSFGRRKSWHIIGTFCVSVSFPLIFSGCLLCQKLPWLKLLWFIPPIMLFQFGWASVQISHLALIPELTTCEHSRMSMTSFRYGFTVIANLSVFAILFLFLSLDGQITTIGPEDLSSFRNLGLFCVGCGLAMTSIFYARISEPIGQRRISQLNLLEDNNTQQQFVKMNWYRWFSYLNFYQTAALYLFSRVYINISQIYFSFYITQTQFLGKRFVALLPLTSYLSSFIISFLLGLSSISKRINGKPLFFFGALLGLLNSFLFFFVQTNWPASSLLLYILSSVLGITQAILLICSLNTTATLINQNTESGAFVYGAMSFFDKLFNGLIVQLVEFFNPLCQRPSLISHSSATCSHFYRDLMSMIPGGCVLAILLLLFTINFRTLTNGRMLPT